MVYTWLFAIIGRKKKTRLEQLVPILWWLHLYISQNDDFKNNIW